MIERDIPVLSPTGAANGSDDLGPGSPDSELRAMACLRLLCTSCPHVLRPLRERLQRALARLLLEPTFDGSAPDSPAILTATNAAELLASLPSVCAGSGPAYADAWLANVILLLGTLQAILARALGSVTGRPLSRIPLPQLSAAGAGGEAGGKSSVGGLTNISIKATGVATGNVRAGGGAGVGCDVPPGVGPAGLADAVGRNLVSALAEREAILVAATGLVQALHACLHPPPRSNGAPTNNSAGVAVPDSRPAVPIPAVPIPVRAICELSLMVLAHDGALPLPAPAVHSLPHASLRSILPEIHVLALQLLHSVLQAARRHALPHAESICDAIQLCWRRTQGNGGLTCTRLRCAAYELASAILRTLGGGVAPFLAEALADAATRDLGGDSGERSEGGDGGEADYSYRVVSGSKRARGGDVLPPFNFSPPAAPEAVQVAAARALQALLCNAGSFTPHGARLRCQHCLLVLAEASSSPPPVFWPAALPVNLPPRASSRLLAVVLRALHASVCTGDSSPQALARTLSSLQAARDSSGSASVIAAATEALHSLDALLHPAGVPLWPKPVATPARPFLGHSQPELPRAPQYDQTLATPGQACGWGQQHSALGSRDHSAPQAPPVNLGHSVPPLDQQMPQAVPLIAGRSDLPTPAILGITAPGASGSIAANGHATPHGDAPQAGAGASFSRPPAPDLTPLCSFSPAPPVRAPKPAETSVAGLAGFMSQPPVRLDARPTAHSAVQQTHSSASANPPPGSAAPGEDSDSSDPEIMLDGPDGG
jgi:hypothetical protein